MHRIASNRDLVLRCFISNIGQCNVSMCYVVRQPLTIPVRLYNTSYNIRGAIVPQSFVIVQVTEQGIRSC